MLNDIYQSANLVSSRKETLKDIFQKKVLLVFYRRQRKKSKNMESNKSIIIPRQLAESDFFFREAQRRCMLAGRSVPERIDWPPQTPTELIEVFEKWSASSSNTNIQKNEQEQEEDVAWDPW